MLRLLPGDHFGISQHQGAYALGVVADHRLTEVVSQAAVPVVLAAQAHALQGEQGSSSGLQVVALGLRVVQHLPEHAGLLILELMHILHSLLQLIAIFKIKASSCKNETIRHSRIAKYGRKQSGWHLVEHRLFVL